MRQTIQKWHFRVPLKIEIKRSIRVPYSALSLTGTLGIMQENRIKEQNP